MVRSGIVAFGITLAAVAPASAENASIKRGTGSDTIQGTVRFDGAPPERKPQQRASDPYCARTAALSEDVVVTDGKLKDAVVRITAGPPRKSATPPGPALIDQKDCSYAPRVLGIAAGQQIQARNSDGTFHNVHGTRAGQQLWNQPAVPGSKDLVLDTADAKSKPGDVLEVTCDVHPWMHAYAVVVDGPFAVTDASGGFALEGLKPGTYTLEAWHPTLGTATAQASIRTGAKAPARVDLVFRAKK